MSVEAVQLRLIVDAPAAVAVRLAGTEGATLSSVVALATPEYPLRLFAASAARTR